MLVKTQLRVMPRGAPAATVAMAMFVTTISVKPWDGQSLSLAAARTAIALLAIGAGFALDDPAAATLAASPTSLPRRRAVRCALAVAGAAAGLGLIMAGARLWSGEAAGAPLTAVLLEGAALCAVALAASAVSIGWRGAASGGPAAIRAVLLLVLVDTVTSRSFPKWSLQAAPGSPTWSQSRWLWAAVLAAAMATLAWQSKDPAARWGRR